MSRTVVYYNKIRSERDYIVMERFIIIYKYKYIPGFSTSTICYPGMPLLIDFQVGTHVFELQGSLCNGYDSPSYLSIRTRRFQLGYYFISVEGIASIIFG